MLGDDCFVTALFMTFESCPIANEYLKDHPKHDSFYNVSSDAGRSACLSA